MPHVVFVRSPLTPAGQSQVSADGRIVYAVVQFDAAGDNLPNSAINAVTRSLIGPRALAVTDLAWSSAGRRSRR